MSAWDTYEQRIGVRGQTKRDMWLKRESRNIFKRLPESLSYQSVILFDGAHGYDIDSEDMQQYKMTQNVGIINSDNLDEKTIISMPGEDIMNGSLIDWMDQHWLMTERDANTTLYTRGKLLQCNYLLKWVDDDHQIHEQWCKVEDGTKYLTGELEDWLLKFSPLAQQCA